ncbi:MAG: hypothetical protein JXQ71_03245 [Verrucomicrobia bacterium]|nr:hypothetical protein [Verrucomicrobiota bacterium]
MNTSFRIGFVAWALALGVCGWVDGLATRAAGASAVLLFEDDFNRTMAGWTAVQPGGIYIDGPMRWQYDIVSGAWVENSNIYTDGATASPSATAVMLVNDAVAPDPFTFQARLTAGDDDGFGLVFGYEDEINFYRVTFDRQVNATRAAGGYPGVGWKVDRKVDDVTTTLFGSGSAGGAILFTNVSNRPFDVTIDVAAGNVFSLTVVDDPAGAATVHPLVVSQPLPGPAGGRVGLTVWGMSGSVPRGCRFANLTLSPVALVNNPPADTLTAWTPVVPPRASGPAVLNGPGQGLWALALGPNGAYGTLNETSDCFDGNDAAGRLDFAAPTLVAGEDYWTDYVVRARIIPGDDDGHGMLLRYLNDSNFYRIALRSQSSSTGVRRGLSVQKMASGTFEEMFYETTAQYNPVANRAYDLLASIAGNELEIVVVADPEGAAQSYHYGPVYMGGVSGLTVDQGKVGVFSWGMFLTQFDFIRVEAVQGVPLDVSSPFGPADPPVGLNDFDPGAEVTASVPAFVEDLPGVRRVCTGFTGFGSVPATGSTNSVTFTLNAFSAITWQWRTDYRLTVPSNQPSGIVIATPGEWQPEGTPVEVTAVPEFEYVFGGWSGDSLSTDPSLSFTMTRPISLVPLFLPDFDMDGMADAWEEDYFGDMTQEPTGDFDGDGRNNVEEFTQGSDPTFVETVVATDGLSAQFENAQRDPALAGEFLVQDFGMGFHGAFDTSNDYRRADDPANGPYVANVSFEGPRMVVRNDVWDPAWSSNFTARVIMTVGDNDGNCVYWRYQNHSNWYRVTVCGEDNPAGWRALLGVSVQKRIGDTYTQLALDSSFFTDPDDGTDPASIVGWKRIRVNLTSVGTNHTVMVEGWDVDAVPPSWNPGSVTLSFTDADLADGRLAVGHWGQGVDPALPTAEMPIDDGVLIEDVAIEVDSTTVFHENWSMAPLPEQFPAGWSNPYAGVLGLQGDWRMSAHGTIVQMSNFAPPTSSTASDARADADAMILLAPDPGVANYQLELGFHPFDDDGIGFVYDYVDADNFARAMFVSEASGATRIPQGLNISRKSGGVWSDIVVEDLNFVYQPGHPFAVRFSNNNGQYRLFAWNIDDPGTVHGWTWADQQSAATNRFGLTTWGEIDAHVLYARALSLPEGAAPELRILDIRAAGEQVTLQVLNTTGNAYNVEVSLTLDPASWSPVASGLTATEWTGSVPTGATTAFYRLVATP